MGRFKKRLVVDLVLDLLLSTSFLLKDEFQKESKPPHVEPNSPLSCIFLEVFFEVVIFSVLSNFFCCVLVDVVFDEEGVIEGAVIRGGMGEVMVVGVGVAH